MSAAEHGDPAAGGTILLLHGGSVAGWSWAPQVALLPERHLLTPDLPGFGERHGTPWPGLDGAADDLAALVAARAAGGRAHVVGLSLGGIVGLRLAARHPVLVRSLLVSGVPGLGVGPVTRVLARAQARLWDRPWYWRAQAAAMRLDDDVRERFVRDGLRLGPRTGAAVLAEVARPNLPAGLGAYEGPLLVVAGGSEPRDAARAFDAIRELAPQARTWVAPGMHHHWSAEDPALFSCMVEAIADGRGWPAADAGTAS